MAARYRYPIIPATDGITNAKFVGGFYIWDYHEPSRWIFAQGPLASTTSFNDRGIAISLLTNVMLRADFVLSSLGSTSTEFFKSPAATAVIVNNRIRVEINGASAQSVTFTGSTGVLILDDAQGFTGQVSGLTGSDAIDLTDVQYGSTTTSTFSGGASGGILTVSNGNQTANIALVGDYVQSGWTLSSDGHGGTVVVDPPLAGTVYANATNTGIQSGTNLKAAASSDYTINTPGVYSGLIFTKAPAIECSNVTLEDCLIEETASDWTGVYVAGGLSNVVIQNCEIAGAGVNSTQEGATGISVMGDSQVSIYNNNIHDVGNGFGVTGGQVVIENNYVHNFESAAGTHFNGMETNGGATDFSLLMEDNSIINNLDQTDAVMIDNQLGTSSNITITNNLLIGGDYTVYVDGSKGSYAITNVNISNNDLGSGTYGYWYLSQGSLSSANYQVTTSGNVDDGAILLAALPISPIVSLASAIAGNYNSGNTLTLTLYTSEVVTVSGTPTLTLNDGGIATYTGGTGTNALTFSYTVATGQTTSNSPALAVIGVSAEITDLNGNSLNASRLPAYFSNVTINLPNPAPPAGTSADLMMSNGTTGNYEIYDIGHNAILAAYPLTQISSPWTVAGLGGLDGTDTSDMLVRNAKTGAFEVYDVNNNNVTGIVSMGQVGLEWQVAGFGDFSGHANETDMLMRNSSTGQFEIYDISNNAIYSAAPMGQVGTEWSMAGFGDFSGHANETDMLMRNSSTGQFEIYDISNNAIYSAAPMGQVGTEWSMAGFGDFSGHANETDMLMRNSRTGQFEIYDISNNAIYSAAPMGQVGTEWSVVAFGDFSGNAGETDMLMQNTTTGQFEVYDINHNQITAAQSMGQVGSAWTTVGVAGISTAQLTQAMASFAPAGGVLPTSSQIDQPSAQIGSVAVLVANNQPSAG